MHGHCLYILGLIKSRKKGTYGNRERMKLFVGKRNCWLGESLISHGAVICAEAGSLCVCKSTLILQSWQDTIGGPTREPSTQPCQLLLLTQQLYTLPPIPALLAAVGTLFYLLTQQLYTLTPIPALPATPAHSAVIHPAPSTSPASYSCSLNSYTPCPLYQPC